MPTVFGGLLTSAASIRTFAAAVGQATAETTVHQVMRILFIIIVVGALGYLGWVFREELTGKIEAVTGSEATPSRRQRSRPNPPFRRPESPPHQPPHRSRMRRRLPAAST